MRRKRSTKREPAPDPKFGDVLMAKFIHCLMLDGKKSVARNVLYNALDEIKRIDNKLEPASVFAQAIRNVTPQMEIRSRRVGGANYQVPREVNQERGLALAIRWLIQAADAKKGKPMSMRLADEFVLASKNEGAAIKKKIDTHKMAEANRAFAHFAW